MGTVAHRGAFGSSDPARGRKVHLAMDTTTPGIRAEEVTLSSDGDSPVWPGFLDQIPNGEEIGTMTAPSRQIASQSPVPLPGSTCKACVTGGNGRSL